MPVEPNKPSLAQCGGIWRRNWAEDRTQDKTQDRPNLLKVVARFRDQTGPQNWSQTGRNYGTLSHVQNGAAWEPLATVSHLYQFGPNGNRGVIVQQRWVRTDVNRSNPLVQFQLVKGSGCARIAGHRRSVRSCHIARTSIPFEVDFGKNGPQLRRNLDPLSPLGSNFGPIWLLLEVHIVSTRRTLLPHYAIEKKMNFH